jgi:hypothetical protein
MHREHTEHAQYPVTQVHCAVAVPSRYLDFIGKLLSCLGTKLSAAAFYSARSVGTGVIFHFCIPVAGIIIIIINDSS